ncbi:molecular chaperone DnaJ [Pseudomonas gingeri]|uniref:molecular chaperone DnaJ n=1 Tax=Pseudomonas gingeri TaxID=117681 RepID=UPI0015BDE548|nr:molecular chaperone DnaJ [Pseudomonas gingeri]NWD47040.1 molecular chaperone DnaJ [Pseudomonas gingeri]
MKDKSSGLSVTPAPGKRKLPAGQKKFNTLIKDIEKKRRELEAWESNMPFYIERWSRDFKPLLDQYFQNNLELLQLLDDASERVKLSKADRQTLREEILALAVSLTGGENDEAIKNIYNRHSPEDYDTLEREEEERLKQGYQEMFGFELGDDVDLRSEEAVTQRLHEQMQAQHNASHKPAGKKTAQQLRAEKDEQQASQSVREVFRKLASALHPDRETDAGERERKTALMQRVNQAYGERDLLALLQLQLEVEQINADDINALPADRLKHYNRVLSEQLGELNIEVQLREFAFMEQFAAPLLLYDISPANLPVIYDSQLEQLRFDVENQILLRAEINEPKGLKAWLKAQRAYEKEQELDDLGLDELSRLFFR